MTKTAAPAVPDEVEQFLEHHPYVRGFTPCSADADLYNRLRQSGVPAAPNLSRWYGHMDSFTALERGQWARVGA